MADGDSQSLLDGNGARRRSRCSSPSGSRATATPGVAPPDEETCCAETGERMVMAEFTTLEPEDEPVASKGS